MWQVPFDKRGRASCQLSSVLELGQGVSSQVIICLEPKRVLPNRLDPKSAPHDTCDHVTVPLHLAMVSFLPFLDIQDPTILTALSRVSPVMKPIVNPIDVRSDSYILADRHASLNSSRRHIMPLR